MLVWVAFSGDDVIATVVVGFLTKLRSCSVHFYEVNVSILVW